MTARAYLGRDFEGDKSDQAIHLQQVGLSARITTSVPLRAPTALNRALATGDRRRPLKRLLGKQKVARSTLALGHSTHSDTQIISKRIPAFWSRASSASPIAWAGVTWPAVSGLSSRARQSAASDSIFAVSV